MTEMGICGKCMGSGYGGHPDSGVLCYDCNGSGGIRADLSPSPEVVKELVEAAGDFLDAIFAEYENGDRKLRITGPTANLKWLIEAEEELRAALAKMEGGE